MSGITEEEETALELLLVRAELIRKTRYRRRSAYCGGSDPVPDGVDVRLLKSWLEECLAYARRFRGPQSETVRRLAERLSHELSVEDLEGALIDLVEADS